MTARLPPQARVRARTEFDAVFQSGHRTAAPLLALHWRPGPEPARLGLAVSRKVDRHAVGRNRIKRAWRETFRHLRTQLPGGAYVVVARTAASTRDNAALRAALIDVLRRAGALPVSPADGTMPGASPSSPTTPEPSGA